MYSWFLGHCSSNKIIANEKTKYKTRKKQKQKTGRQVTSRLL